MRCLSVSTDSTLTSTSWPSLTTSLALFTRPWPISEMWISPSTPGFEFHERAKLHQLGDGAFDRRTGGILAGHAVPRVVGQVAIGEADLAGFFVDFLNADFHRLPFAEHVARMIDTFPAELANVNQSVDAAQVDERAEILQAANGAFANLAGCQLFE